MDKLNQLEEIINIDNGDHNQTILLGHHPQNQISSERSDNGNNFLDLIYESNTTMYLNGHIHYQNYHSNHHGAWGELMCPSFEDRYMYRICAFDDDVFSFSDVTVDEYPQVVVTSPTDSQFYNLQMPLENVITHNEIRALIFDDKLITDAFKLLDSNPANPKVTPSPV